MTPKVPHPKPRIIGITARDYPYKGSLLTVGPHVKIEKPSQRPRTPEDVTVPPIGSSDENSELSSLLSDADLSGLESPPPRTKRTRTTKVRVPVVGATAQEGQSGHGPDKVAAISHGSMEPSRISHTTWKSSGRNLEGQNMNGKHNGGKRRSQEIEEEGPFDDFTALHKRPQTYYGGLGNIHGFGALQRKKISGRNSFTAVTKNEKNGFRKPNTKDIDAILNKESTKVDSSFNDPTEACDAALQMSRRTRRSTRNFDEERDVPAIEFREPPLVPPRLKHDEDGVEQNSFLVPAMIPKEKAHHKTSAVFKNPLQGLCGTLDLSNLSKSEQAAFRTPLEPPPPTSSASISAVPSFSTPASSMSSLSSPPSSPTLSSSLSPCISNTLPPTSLCPICLSPVPPSLLTTFLSSHPRQTVKHQTAFCFSHKRLTAQNIWQTRGYPTIDWPKLPTRLFTYDTLITDILELRRKSHYRTKLTQRVRDGRSRSLVQSLVTNNDTAEGGMTGYYGSRGARVMMDHLIGVHAGQLRRLSGTDKLIASCGGVSTYVQAVLVPELATAVVGDDLGVGAEDARKVLGESAEVGRLLCEEVDDVILREADDEEEEEQEEEEEEEEEEEDGRDKDEDKEVKF